MSRKRTDHRLDAENFAYPCGIRDELHRMALVEVCSSNEKGYGCLLRSNGAEDELTRMALD